MSSSNIKREIKTVTIVDSFASACDSESSHSNPELYKTALEKTSSEKFELARDHFSTTYFLEYDTVDEFKPTKPNTGTCSAKKMHSTPKPKAKIKTGSCNCKTSKQKNRKLKLETPTASESETQTNVDQKYNIDVPEISAKYSSSGIIKIPIEVRLTLKQSGHNTPVKQENVQEDAKPVSTELPSIKCIYQDCPAWEYMESYLDELLDETNGKDASLYNYAKYGNDLIFNAECTDHYAEPYHKVGYVTSEDEYIVPIDPEDLIPPEYYAKDKDSFWVEKVSEKELSEAVDPDSPINWKDVCLPPKGTVEIAPAPPEPEEPIAPHRIPVPEGYQSPPSRAEAKKESKKKKSKCAKISSCCGSEDDNDDDEYCLPRRKQTSVLFKPVPKISLIYGQNCMENEPYTRPLLKAYPHHGKSDSPCSSNTEMPWPKLLLPEAVKIRSVDIIDLTEIKTEPSTSTNALCLCGSIKDKRSKPNKIPSKKSVSASDLCLCASNNNLPDKLDVKPNIKKTSEPNTTASKNSVTFRNNKLVTLYPPRNLPVAQSKSNTIKSEVSTRKEPISIIKTKLSGKSKSDEGIMRTKVTISGKDLNLESQGKIKVEPKQICPLASGVKVSSSHSAPVLPKQEPCVPETCSENIKVESSSHTIKPDPVISALIACEAELKPVKQALNTVQQKLRNMNMPELDSIFSKGTELANVFLNKAQQNRCTCATNYVSGYNPTTTMKPANVKFMNARMATYARPFSSYPSPSNTYMPQGPRPYVEQCQLGPAPYYGQYQSSSLSQSSSCAPSVQNFSMRPNYDRNDLYPDERGPSKSAIRRPGYRNKQRVKYERDQSEDYRSTDRSERICCCSSSNYSSHNGFHMKKSDNDMTSTSSSSPSEDSMTKTRRNRSRHRRLVPKAKKQNSGIVSKQSLCPFLEAMKSIMIVDNKKTVKRGINGVSYDAKLKNMRMHMRVRTSKLRKK